MSKRDRSFIADIDAAVPPARSGGLTRAEYRNVCESLFLKRMTQLSPFDKAEVVNSAVAEGAVYVSAGDGLNTRQVLGARVIKGSLQLQTKRGYEHLGGVPFLGLTHKSLW